MREHDADHEALIEAMQNGVEVEFVNRLLAAAQAEAAWTARRDSPADSTDVAAIAPVGVRHGLT